MRFLMDLIGSLQKSGMISVARMCVTCRFLRPDAQRGEDSSHYCALLDVPLAGSELRTDCPEHELAASSVLGTLMTALRWPSSSLGLDLARVTHRCSWLVRRRHRRRPPARADPPLRSSPLRRQFPQWTTARHHGHPDAPKPSGARPNARLLYDFEVEYRRQGWGDPAYVHDEERELFRFRDGRFAFSREHADWALLRKRGWLRGRE